MRKLNDEIKWSEKKAIFFRKNNFRTLNYYLLAGIVIALSAIRGEGAEHEMSMTPFTYTQDFEGADPVTFWCSNGKYTVNFKGLTKEKAYSGKKSFKLDVTFHSGSYFYWEIPAKIPAEGKLNFSGHIMLGKENTAKVGLGLNYTYPPTQHSGCTTFSRHTSTQEKWKTIECNLVKLVAERKLNSVRYLWGIMPKNLGTYINKVGIFIYGQKGQRAVLYIDDIKIEGEVPAEKSYEKNIRKRWAPAAKKISNKISLWEKKLKEIDESILSLTKLSNESEKLKQEAERKQASLKTKIAGMKGQKSIRTRDAKKMDVSLERLKSLIKNINKTQKEHLLYILSPITGFKTLPLDDFVPGKISDEMRIVACQGEYEPGSFVVSALSDINSLEVKPTELKGKNGIIPSENIDIKVVKCWYQAGSAWRDIVQDKGTKVLVPELLLNDDSLVLVNHLEKKNYLKLSFPKGEKYVCISDQKNKKKDYSYKLFSTDKYPVKDSEKLLPVNIPAKSNKQFWVTIKVPEKVQPGLYNGKILLKTPKAVIGEIKISLEVLSFKLLPPYYTSSIYYLGRLNSENKGTISSALKSEKQLRKELENMFAHGISNTTVCQGFNPNLIKKYLNIRNEVGMSGQPFYYLGWFATPPSPDELKRIVEFAKSYGVPEVYFYGIDEAKGEALNVQLPMWNTIHQAGAKVYVAGSIAGENFERVGNVQDLFICAGRPSKAEAKRWHSVGHKIFSYANPQGGVENPEVYRRNFGLLLFKNEYDGAMTYAYQDSFGGNIWNDFDDVNYRDHNFTYPTVDGVIDTIAWEGYREGVDDVRYVTTLLHVIEKAKKLKNSKAEQLVAEAEKFLKTLDVEYSCLDNIRSKIIDYITRITQTFSKNTKR